MKNSSYLFIGIIIGSIILSFQNSPNLVVLAQKMEPINLDMTHGTVSLVKAESTDLHHNPKWFFKREQDIYLNVTIDSTLNTTVTALLAVTLFDSQLFIINNEVFEVLIKPGRNMQNVSLYVPSYAFVGLSEAYISLLKIDPEIDGVPYSPEVSTNFMITDKSLDTEIKSQSALIGVQSEGNKFSNFSIDYYVNPSSGLHFPFGLFSFNLTVEPGSAVNVTLHLYDTEGIPVQLDSSFDYWKYSPDGKGAPNGETGWFNFSSVIVNNTMMFTLIDGGKGDGDGMKNGVIRDPAGPGIRIDATNNKHYPVGGELIQKNILVIINKVKDYIYSFIKVHFTM